MLAQELLRGDGEDLEVYVAGRARLRVRKEFSATSFTVPGRPARVRPELRQIALACGRVLGLGLYGARRARDGEPEPGVGEAVRRVVERHAGAIVVVDAGDEWVAAADVVLGAATAASAAQAGAASARGR